MTDESRNVGQRLAKRKAWQFRRPLAPRFSEFFASKRSREAFVQYWLKDNFWNALHLAAFFCLRLMPMDVVSRLGAALGRYAVPRYHQIAASRARETIRRLGQTNDHAEHDRLFEAYCSAQGRFMTEFSVVNRLARHPDRIMVSNIQIVKEAAQAGPVIMVGLHLGNWEICPIVAKNAGLKLYTMYVPPFGRAKAWIASYVRRKSGVQLLPPGVQGVRPAIRILNQGGVVAIFCDEAFGGKIRGPFFGATPHLQGNLGLVVRLAKLTGATICPWYTLREQGCRFVVTCLPPMKPSFDSGDAEGLVEAVQRLNALIEPVIAGNLEQWYFVDSSLPD